MKRGGKEAEEAKNLRDVRNSKGTDGEGKPQDGARRAEVGKRNLKGERMNKR